MGILAKPPETKEHSTLFYGSWQCGGERPHYYRKRRYRERYVDTAYHKKVELNEKLGLNDLGLAIPPLVMPYKAYESESYQVPCRVLSNSQMRFYESCFGPPSISGFELSLKSESRVQADQVLFDKLSDLKEVNLGIALAESKKTIGLATHTLRRLALTYRSLRRGQVGDAFKALGIVDKTKLKRNKFGADGRHLDTAGDHRKYLAYRAPSSRYRNRLVDFAAETMLEISYGWTPLLLDIYGTAAHVQKLLNATSSDVVLDAYGVVQKSDSWSNSSGALTVTAQMTAITRWHLELKLVEDYYRSATSLGLDNPALVGWELVPFSFVVDWFLPIGKFLESVTAMNGISVVQKSLSTKLEGFNHGRYYYPSYAEGEAVCTQVKSEYERVTNVNVPMVRPTGSISAWFNPKRFGQALSLLRVVTR